MAECGFGMRLAIASISKRFPQARNISTTWLEGRLHHSQESSSSTSPVKILDCRSEEEFNISHIEDAVNINYESPAEEILTVWKIDQSTHGDHSHGNSLVNTEAVITRCFTNAVDVVCYCSVGYRSALVAQKLQDHVRKSTEDKNLSFYNLKGGLFKWANENRRMVDLQGEITKFAHPYNAVFGKLLNSELHKS
ncbi:uncharacterized protein LOC125683320 isoform X1 [Ostrea edulis]|uniref:uncharacterized protein LOC125683320 isoform X1 n=1 Tax=Ostrea edulis TaxID=37623 RepID=UPI0024AEFB9A|nr:uncharacterized protein LOC125683320 isoform X1 [Ostrea edulis]XP_048780326.2 uncharacterized protein LOC125683320 isoform X1 [Ostrea edulis]